MTKGTKMIRVYVPLQNVPTWLFTVTPEAQFKFCSIAVVYESEGGFVVRPVFHSQSVLTLDGSGDFNVKGQGSGVTIILKPLVPTWAVLAVTVAALVALALR